jgi:hypothetical protein
MHKVRLSLLVIFAVILSSFFLPCLAQTHRVGTAGPDTPPLEGAGRWHYLASLPHARGEVAVAEAGGKIYVLGGYADGFVDQPLNEEYDPNKNAWRGRAPMPRGLKRAIQYLRVQHQPARHLRPGERFVVIWQAHADRSQRFCCHCDGRQDLCLRRRAAWRYIQPIRSLRSGRERVG